MNICLLIIAGILGSIGVSECLECFNCLNIADPRACTNRVQCSNSESCYLQTLHSDNETKYNMGCQNNQLCSSAAVNPNGIIGRSIQTRQQYSCHECCSNNRCNSHLCGHSKPTSCVDDATLDCARLNSLLNVCADVHHAKTICPQFCGLCQLVDGNWAAWGAWSTCSVTCNNGTQTRTRTCSNPAPANSGLNCTGPIVESNMCLNQLCPVHGNWSEWSTWSNCSVDCNVGVRTRTHTCTNPPPDRSGNDCVGDSSEYTVCLNKPCIVISHAVAFNAHGFNELSNNVNAFPTVIFNEGMRTITPLDTSQLLWMGYTTLPSKCAQSTKMRFFFHGKGIASMSGAIRVTTTANYHYHYNTCTSASSSVKLTRNEHVWVLMKSHYTAAQIAEADQSYWNTFTGTLIQEL